jgi:hypothetical protein
MGPIPSFMIAAMTEERVATLVGCKTAAVEGGLLADRAQHLDEDPTHSTAFNLTLTVYPNSVVGISGLMAGFIIDMRIKYDEGSPVQCTPNGHLQSSIVFLYTTCACGLHAAAGALSQAGCMNCTNHLHPGLCVHCAAALFWIARTRGSCASVVDRKKRMLPTSLTLKKKPSGKADYDSNDDSDMKHVAVVSDGAESSTNMQLDVEPPQIEPQQVPQDPACHKRYWLTETDLVLAAEAILKPDRELIYEQVKQKQARFDEQFEHDEEEKLFTVTAQGKRKRARGSSRKAERDKKMSMDKTTAFWYVSHINLIEGSLT